MPQRKTAHLWYDPRPLYSTEQMLPMFACSYPLRTVYDIRCESIKPLVESLLRHGFNVSLCPEAKLLLSSLNWAAKPVQS